MPGLRQAQKYAVRVGGGQNQRLALWDGILIKENHIAAAGGIARRAADAARALDAGVPVQIEVESLDELEQALRAAPPACCSTTSRSTTCTAPTPSRRAARCSRPRAASTWTACATSPRTGVDRISVGKLTKDVRAIDLSMRFVAP